MKNGEFDLFVKVRVERMLPLAKGGSVVTGGVTITQKDIKTAHDGDLHQWQNSKGGVELYHEVTGIQFGEPGEDGTPTEIARKEFWYFPSVDDGRPGRGLTQVGGKPLTAKTTENPNEGEIPAEEAPAAPVAAAPKAAIAIVKKPAVALAAAPKPAAAPVAAAPKPAVAVKPAAAPAAPVAVARPVVAVKPAAGAPVAVKKPLVLAKK